MKIHLSKICLIILFLNSCFPYENGKHTENFEKEDNKNFTQYVNPFIGTGGHGHTFPGVTLPHGMVQLSPDTRLLGWDGCSGYHYSDSTIMGFSHTHLSGTGIGDYGDILFTPLPEKEIAQIKLEGLKTHFPSAFSHDKEKSKPGYYQVLLQDFNIEAELTATERAGFHKYSFPEGEKSAILIDLTHNLQHQQNKALEIEFVNNKTIRGMKRTSGWAKDQIVYFYAEFSMPFTQEIFEGKQRFKDRSNFKGNDIKALLTFDRKESEQVFVKIGLSNVSEEGAQKNLDKEIADWDFDGTVETADKLWNKQLSIIDISTDSEEDQTIFYTSLYHAFISPNIYSDVDGSYRAMDHTVQKREGQNNYTVFSLWDTFRALHPLLTIVAPEEDGKMINSLVDKYETGGVLPMWELASNYTGTMIGSHAISVIVDAHKKGITGFDVEKAYAACVKSTMYDTTNIAQVVNREILNNKLIPMGKYYKNTIGYLPSDKENEAVAKGLEYAYNDWCVAQLAKELGKMEDYEKFSKLAENYKHYYDPVTGFMRGKMSDGSWKVPFNPKASNHRHDDYCEGNAWQWLWFVPHDIKGLTGLMGGEEKLVLKLDSLFSIDSNLEGEEISADISGLIGQYAHGNEPGHHTTHIYNQVKQPWKTQELVDEVLQTLYFNDPDGLSGNEDCGQMSAWYILNAMGFYSFCPGSDQYSIGRPMFDDVTINLSNGNKFRIKAENNTKENKYIQSATLNGEPLDKPFFQHQDILDGSELIFKMGNKPNKSWGLQSL